MPSSPNATILSVSSFTEGDATVAAWQPASLGAGAPAGTEFTLPPFESAAHSARPSVRAFAISRTAGIPEDLLAAASASARAAGYAAGYADGIEEARAATRDRLAAQAAADEAAASARDASWAQAFDAVFAAAAELESLAVQSARDIEDEIVSAAWAIASAVIGQALTDDDVRSQAALTRALALAPADEAVTVAVSPEDFAVLAAVDADAASDGAASNDVVAEGGLADTSGHNTPVATGIATLRRTRGLRTVTIIADEALRPGDAVATCGATTIDARLSTAVDRVRQVLGQ